MNLAPVRFSGAELRPNNAPMGLASLERNGGHE
jgi:hypothetical protein